MYINATIKNTVNKFYVIFTASVLMVFKGCTKLIKTFAISYIS